MWRGRGGGFGGRKPLPITMLRLLTSGKSIVAPMHLESGKISKLKKSGLGSGQGGAREEVVFNLKALTFGQTTNLHVNASQLFRWAVNDCANSWRAARF